jgi:hypothetical protein
MRTFAWMTVGSNQDVFFSHKPGYGVGAGDGLAAGVTALTASSA